MADILFIKESYLKEMSVINDNVDMKILKPTIIMVQDLYLQEILGTPLFEDLKTKITADPTLSTYPNELLLMDSYISKCLVWYIKMEAIMEFKFRYMNKGVMVKSSADSQPAETGDLQMLKDGCSHNAKQYAELLTKYLQNNTTLFPKYYEYTLVGMNHKLKNYSANIYLNDFGPEPIKMANGSNFYI